MNLENDLSKKNKELLQEIGIKSVYFNTLEAKNKHIEPC